MEEMTADEMRAAIEKQILDRYMARLNENAKIAIDEAMKLARSELQEEHERKLRREIDSFGC